MRLKRLIVGLFSCAMLAMAPVVSAAEAGGSPLGAGGKGRAHGPGVKPFPELIQLPIGFQPEGIAAGRGSTFYVGSIPTGAVFRGDFRTGAVSPLVPAHAGRATIGVAFDARGDRLFVAGGPTGMAFVYDASTGADVAAFQLAAGPSFINDVVVARNGAWFTDSLNQVLYRVPSGKHRSLGSSPETVPLSGDIVFQPGFNTNGIDATPNGKTLVIVQTNTGKLFTVDAGSGVASEIDLGGGDVLRGDGVLLLGRTLFVVQNVFNRVAVVELGRGLREGRIVRYITDSDLDVPTTIDVFAGRLWAVNARFGVPAPDTQQFQVVQLRP